MSTNKLLKSASDGRDTSWLSTLLITGVPSIGNSIAIDTNKNTYITGQANTTASAYAFVAKYNSAGSLSWQVSLDTASNIDVGNGIALDSTGNVYVVGQANSTTIANAYGFIAKLDTAGNIQWQRKLDNTSETESLNAIAIDSSNNIYATGVSKGYCLVVKYNSAGTLVWQRRITSVNTGSGHGIATDSTGNVYITGRAAATAESTQYCFTLKLNSSGTFLWERKYDIPSTADTGYSIAIGTDSSVHVTGQFGYLTATANTSYIMTLKYDTNGALLWQNKLEPSGASRDGGFGIAVDLANNVFITGVQSQGGSSQSAFVAMYNAAGSLQWQRLLDMSVNNSSDSGTAIAVDTSGNMFLTGQLGVNYAFVAKLPADGTILKSGTYTAAGGTVNYTNSVMVNTVTTGGDSIGTQAVSVLSKDHWLTTIDVTASDEILYGVCLDSSGNVYTIGSSSAGGDSNTVAILAKYDSLGVSLWKRKLDTSGYEDIGYGVSTDTSGNVYVVGKVSSAPLETSFIVKYDSTGTLIFKYTIPLKRCSCITVNSLGNLVFGGFGTTNLDSLVTTMSPAGILITQNTLTAVSTAILNCVTTSADNSIYAAGQFTATDGFIVKYDVSGNLQWKLILKSFKVNAIACDASNVYLTGVSGTVTPIMAINSSGTVLWQKSLSAVAGQGMCTDSFGFVYVTGSVATGTAGKSFIAKYNSAGTLQWQQTFKNVTSNSIIYGITAASTDIYVVGMSYSTTVFAFAGKLLNTGDLLVGAANLTYELGTLTEATTSITSSSSFADFAYWSSELTPVGTSKYTKVGVDSVGNIIAVGGYNWVNASFNQYAIIVKYTTQGQIIWQNKIDVVSSNDEISSVLIDSSNNIYVVGTSVKTSGDNDIFIIKLDSNGGILWQRMAVKSGLGNIAYEATLDSTGAICVPIQTQTYSHVIKYDTSGTFAWQRVSTVATGYFTVYSIAADSSNNIYLTGCTDPTNGTLAKLFVIKYDSTGALQWSRQLKTSASSIDIGYEIAVSSAGNCYITGVMNAAYSIIAKYDTNGAIQWQRTFGSGQNVHSYALCIDSSENVYITGRTTPSTPTTSVLFIAKYNSSGVIQWQNRLDNASTADIGLGIATKGTNLYIAAQLKAGTTATITASTPAVIVLDTAGTILSPIQAVTTFTDAAGTIAESAFAFTEGAGTLVLTTPTLTLASTLFATTTSYFSLNNTKYPVGGFLFGNTNVRLTSSVGDSSGNLYVTGFINSTGTGLGSNGEAIVVMKLNSSGTLIWQRRENFVIGGVQTSSRGYSIALDTSNNVYITGYCGFRSDAANNQRTILMKFDTNGALQWQRVNGYTGFGDMAYAVALDSSSNVYRVGVSGNGTNPYVGFMIAKYNTSGTIQWQKFITIPNLFASCNAVVVDSSANLYIVGHSGNYGGACNGVIVKMATATGTITWQKFVGIATMSNAVYGIAINTANNAIYVVGTANDYASATSAYAFVAKYDTNGNLQWQNILNSTSFTDQGRSIVLDSSENVYIAGTTYDSAKYIPFVAKYNSSGTLQWKYYLTPASTLNIFHNALTIVNNFLHLTFHTGTDAFSGTYGELIRLSLSDTTPAFFYANSNLVTPSSAAFLLSSAGALVTSAGNMQIYLYPNNQSNLSSGYVDAAGVGTDIANTTVFVKSEIGAYPLTPSTIITDAAFTGTFTTYAQGLLEGAGTLTVSSAATLTNATLTIN